MNRFLFLCLPACPSPSFSFFLSVSVCLTFSLPRICLPIPLTKMNTQTFLLLINLFMASNTIQAKRPRDKNRITAQIPPCHCVGVNVNTAGTNYQHQVDVICPQLTTHFCANNSPFCGALALCFQLHLILPKLQDILILKKVNSVIVIVYFLLNNLVCFKQIWQICLILLKCLLFTPNTCAQMFLIYI